MFIVSGSGMLRKIKKFDQVRGIEDAQITPATHVLVLLPDYQIKNSMSTILAQISKVLLTRDRRLCLADTKPIMRVTRNNAILYGVTRHRIDNERGRENLLQYARF